MSAFDTGDIRNIGLVGHGKSGKTTLTSSLLFRAGAVNRLGRVDEGNSVTDFDPEEIERKASISAALGHASWEGKKLNLIDTPGEAAFVHEANAALKVADLSLSVVCGVSGVEVQTEKTWRFAGDHGVPRAVVINKLDRERADFQRILAQLKETFGRELAAVHLPVGSEADFKGVVDLIQMKAFLYPDDESGKGKEGDIPADLQEAAAAAREQLMESIAETDDSLMEHFFEHGQLDDEQMIQGMRQAISSGKVVPVLAASALKGIGVDRLATFAALAFPSPLERGPAKGLSADGEEIERAVDPAAPLSVFVFKTLADPFAGRISLLRVISGTLKLDEQVENYRTEHNEKMANLSVTQGKEMTRVDALPAGDLGCVPKLKDTTTGDTLGAPGKMIRYSMVEHPEGAISFAITPRSRGDEDKLSGALNRLLEEDPALSTTRDSQTHEILLSGSGIKHVEVTLAKMKNRFGVDCVLSPPKVPYRETIRAAAEATARHKKQTGGHGQFAECKISVTPQPSGAGYEFVDKIFGGSISQGYRPAVDKGVQEAAARGFVAGYPMVDFRVTLLDGKEHPVDSSEMAFKIAASMAFKECMKIAKPTLLEPIMDVEVETPEEFMGDIMGDMNSRRGRVQGMDSVGGGQLIRAKVPLSEMLTYSQTLKSISGGRAQFHMSRSHYDEVPAQVQQKIMQENAKAKEDEG